MGIAPMGEAPMEMPPWHPHERGALLNTMAEREMAGGDGAGSAVPGREGFATAPATAPAPATGARAPARPSTAAWLAGLSGLPHALAGPELGPLQLAWLGDAVWELHQRLRQCQRPGRSADLHRAVVAAVRADAQALALEQLEPLLREQELDWVRRGRNRAGRGPRAGEAGVYGRATGFETMVGWLFLQNPSRLAELLDQLEENAR